MSKSRKLGLIVGGALFLVGVVFVFLYEPDTSPPDTPPPVRPAKTAIVESGKSSASRSFTGSVMAQDQVDLSFRVSGPLVQLPVRAGDEVKEGDLIAQIDPRDFRSQVAKIQGSLDQAKAQLTAMKAGAREEDIRILESQVAAAQSEFDNANVEMERYKKLWEGGTVSKSEYDQKKLENDVSRKALAAAKDELEKGKAGARQEDIDAQEAQIRGLEAQLREAQDALNDTSLRAPFDGVIARRFVENFQDVRAKERIVSVQNISDVKIVADVPEAVVAMVRKEHVEKLTASFDFDNNAEEFEVTVLEADLEADRRTRTYAVTVTMKAPETKRILPGMSASVRIHLTKEFAAEGGVPVPADAIFTDDTGKSYVWVVDKDLRVRRTAVTPTDMTSDTILVKGDALKGGERVVTAGVNMIQEGWKIRLLDEDQAN